MTACLICGKAFDPEHPLGWHEDCVEADEHHTPIAKPRALMVKVSRERIRDRTVAHALGHPSTVGMVRESRWLSPEMGVAETGAWLSCGDFSVWYSTAPLDEVVREWRNQ